MKTITLILSALTLFSCSQPKEKEIEVEIQTEQSEEASMKHSMKKDDGRTSLQLNAMQKNHQLKNMRSHLEAVQNIILLLSEDKFDEASTLSYEKLGSTTEMRLMCASFGNETFENLGLAFHKSADEMSEIMKKKNKEESLAALSNTMNYCVQCHASFKQ